MTCQIIKQRNLSNRDAVKVEGEEMRFFWQPFDIVWCMEKRMLTLDAPAAEMTLDCNSLSTKGIFLICAAIHAR